MERLRWRVDLFREHVRLNAHVHPLHCPGVVDDPAGAFRETDRCVSQHPVLIWRNGKRKKSMEEEQMKPPTSLWGN